MASFVVVTTAYSRAPGSPRSSYGPNAFIAGTGFPDL